MKGVSMKERIGAIYKKQGKILVRVRWTDKLGKRREFIRQAEDRQQAKEIRKQLLAEVEKRKTVEHVEAHKMTFAQLAEIYKVKKFIPAEFDENGKKLRGLKSLATPLIILERLIEHFGKARIQEIDSVAIEEYRDKLLASGLKYASANRYLDILRVIFNWAKTKKWIHLTPFETAEEPIIRKSLEVKRNRIMSVDEESRLLAQCTGKRKHLRAMIICAVDTALRKSEQLTLTVSDVDTAFSGRS
jgi:integrase